MSRRAFIAATTAAMAMAMVALSSASAQNRIPNHPRVSARAFKSAALKESRRYLVYLPPGYASSGDTRYPVVYLLHGLGGKGANWFDPAWGAIQQHLDAQIAAGLIQPMIAVAPDGGSGYWTNHLGKPDRRFGDYVAKDLVAEVDRSFRTLARRRGRAVAGVSMGGHGAMSLVLMHPTVFSAAISLGGALFPKAPTHRRVYGRVWGKPPNAAHWAKTSPMVLMTKLVAGAPTTPAIYLQCGDADGLGFQAYARAASKTLHDRQIPHPLRLIPGGGHTWKIWGPEAAHWLPWLNDQWKAP